MAPQKKKQLDTDLRPLVIAHKHFLTAAKQNTDEKLKQLKSEFNNSKSEFFNRLETAGYSLEAAKQRHTEKLAELPKLMESFDSLMRNLNKYEDRDDEDALDKLFKEANKCF